MDNTTPNTQMPPMQDPSTPSTSHGQGALIGSIIIIVIIIIGAFFVIKNTQSLNPTTNEQSDQLMQNQEEPVVDTNAYLDSQSSVSTSDELADIGTDIDATDINSVDYGLDAALQ